MAKEANCRRSTRVVKRPALFKITHKKRSDPELLAAIRRSRVETRKHDTEYSTLDPIPTIYAKMDEFLNPLEFWKKYSKLGEEYGAIKVIPPPQWTSRLPIDFDSFRFRVRRQRMKYLLSGKGFSHPPGLWSADRLQSENDTLLKFVMGSLTKDVESIEREYWKMVNAGDSEVSAYYGADISVSQTLGDPSGDWYIGKDFEGDPWNLKNLSRCKGSLLRHIDYLIPGINSPWLYLGELRQA